MGFILLSSNGSLLAEQLAGGAAVAPCAAALCCSQPTFFFFVSGEHPVVSWQSESHHWTNGVLVINEVQGHVTLCIVIDGCGRLAAPTDWEQMFLASEAAGEMRRWKRLIYIKTLCSPSEFTAMMQLHCGFFGTSHSGRTQAKCCDANSH